jgi:hypothetical protein
MRTYRIGFYPNYAMLRADWRFIGRKARNWRRAVKLVYWLRRRGVIAFAEASR